MAAPVFTLAAALASDPLDPTQTWTDLSAFLRSFSWRYGRRGERDRADQGVATVGLIDYDARLDPDNTASPYWPNVLPGRRVRCQAVLDSVTYDVFQTFVDPETGWPQVWESGGYASVNVATNDAFDMLNNTRLPAGTSLSEEKTGVRISAILDLVDWPAGLRDIDTGQSDVQARDAGDSTALTLIQVAETTERGYFFVAPDGTATFHDRHHRLLAPYTTSQATFCDAPNYAAGRILYRRLVPASSKIVNDWRGSRTGGTAQAAEDASSIGSYGRRFSSLSTEHTTDTELLDALRFELSRTKDPNRRFDEMVFEPGDDTDTWQQILARGLGDRITVFATAPGGGAAIEREVHIEAMQLDWGPGVQASARWRLSPAETTRYWVLGHADLSLLGETTILAF